MTAVMQPSSSPFMSPAFRPGHGILLNPSPRTTAFPLPTPTPTPLPHPASYTSLSSSSSSAATDEDALYSSSTDVDAHPARTHRSRSLPAPHSAPARKIRFAPLPDPRRAVFVTDGGDELPIPLSDDDGMIVSSAASVSGDTNNTKKFTIGMDSRSPSVSPQVHASTNLDWELVDSPRINSYKLPPPALAPESHPPSLASSISSHANYEYTTSPAPSMPSSPTNASCFPGALPSSGKRGLTSKLLRPFTISKKPSLSFSNTSTESVGLPRTSSRDTESFLFGVPLHRFSSAQSTQSAYSTASASTIGPSSFTFGGSLARSQSLTSEPDDSRKKKLLSGMGGGKRKKRPSSASGSIASLQTGQRSAGGGVRMLNGRIYGAKHHNQYQYQNKNPFATVSSRTDPEFVEWGYGGMGSVDSGAGNSVWKKLQSEKRERERKEQEERERAEREKANPEIRVSAPQEEVESKEEEKPVEVVAEKDAPVEEEEAPQVVAEKEEPEHVYTTVAVPVVQAHPHPSRTHSHSEEERERAKSPPALMTPSANEDEEDDDDEESPRSEEASAAGIPEEDEDEEDEDEEEEERRRVTALGAGLEKVSRHKEVEERER